MRKSILICAVMVVVAVALVWAQEPMQQPPAAKKAPLSPPAETSVTIAGKTLTIKYGAPSLRGRTNIFGEGGPIIKDPTYPVWRAGANAATTFHTDADLNIKGLAVPKGDYTIFVRVEPLPWQLIINKQLTEPSNPSRALWGRSGYNKDQDLGMVPMDMSKPPAPIETFKITLSSTGANAGKLQLEWENTIASVPFTVK
jgi:hypothetical protein